MLGRLAHRLAYRHVVAGLPNCRAYTFVQMLTTIYSGTASSLALDSPTLLTLVWESCEAPLKISQSVAIMEVIHAMLGVVRSPVMITATQVASRLWILWGIVNLAPEATTTSVVTVGFINLSLVTLLTAWCLSEVIRYGFFALKEVGSQPGVMVWLRYSGFLVLYPLGVSSELAMVWLAIPVIRLKGLWSIALPNPINLSVSYDVICVLAVAAYLPGFPQLFGYMLKQRRKVLGAGGKAGRGGKKD